MRPLPKKELERLAAICGMFGSDHVGERASAAQKADELIRKQGLTWEQVILARWTAKQTFRWADTLEEKLGTVLASPDSLTEWERSFAVSLNGRHRIDPKQEIILDRLFRKVTVYAAKGRT